MKTKKIIMGLLSVLLVTGTAGLLLAAAITSPPDFYQERGEHGWLGTGPAILPEATAHIKDMGSIQEVTVTAKGFGYNCEYMVSLRNANGDMRMIEGKSGDVFATDWNGEGSYIFRIDSKMLNDWKYIDIYREPGCSASTDNKMEKVAALEIK